MYSQLSLIMSDLTLYDLQKKYEDIDVSLEFIDPSLAERYLAANFEDNRNTTEKALQELTSEMRSGRFTLSDSAICFDIEGDLVNGQHRLQAIIRSKTIQPLVVIRNLPDESKLILDVGRIRKMNDRITISGTPITIKYCSAVRHAMSRCQSLTSLGTTEFSKPRHDEEVKNLYSAHKQFFDRLTELNFGATSAFWIASALKIYVQMENNKYDSRTRNPYQHHMDSLDRAIHWLNITTTGMAGTLNGFPQVIKPEDRAAQLIWKSRNERMTKANKKWCDAYAWGLTVSAAYHFMLGNSPQYVRSVVEDPFASFRKAKSTNKRGFGQ